MIFILTYLVSLIAWKKSSLTTTLIQYFIYLNNSFCKIKSSVQSLHIFLLVPYTSCTALFFPHTSHFLILSTSNSNISFIVCRRLSFFVCFHHFCYYNYNSLRLKLHPNFITILSQFFIILPYLVFLTCL